LKIQLMAAPIRLIHADIVFEAVAEGGITRYGGFSAAPNVIYISGTSALCS
jgi:hypothetical protein